MATEHTNEYIADCIAALEKDLGSSIENLHSSVDSLSRTVSEINRNVKTVIERLGLLSDTVNTQQLTIPPYGSAPMPSHSTHARATQPLSPVSFTIPSIPYKRKTGASKDRLSRTDTIEGFTLNTNTVFKYIVDIVRFEKDYPKSLEAVALILRDCFIGFNNGVRPIDWERLPPAQRMFPETQFTHFCNILEPITRLGPNIISYDEERIVKEVKTSLTSVINGYRQEEYRFYKDNLASLFQRVTSPGFELHLEARDRVSEKIPFQSSFLGIAWFLRLPPETRTLVSFVATRDDQPVPHFRAAQSPYVDASISSPVRNRASASPVSDASSYSDGAL